MSALSQLIRPELVSIHPSASTADEAIGVLARSIIDAGLAHEGLVAAAVAREQRFPTGLVLTGATNVAIPHADPELAITPAIAVATFAEPVPFRQMDEPDESIPVQLVIFLALTDGATQIQTLRTLGALLQDDALLERALAARTPHELIAALGADEAAA